MPLHKMTKMSRGRTAVCYRAISRVYLLRIWCLLNLYSHSIWWVYYLPTLSQVTTERHCSRFRIMQLIWLCWRSRSWEESLIHQPERKETGHIYEATKLSRCHANLPSDLICISFKILLSGTVLIIWLRHLSGENLPRSLSILYHKTSKSTSLSFKLIFVICDG